MSQPVFSQAPSTNNPLTTITCAGCHHHCEISIDESTTPLKITLFGSMAMQVVAWALNPLQREHLTSPSPPNAPSNGARLPTKQSYPVGINSRRAMRILEDHLCLEILQDKEKPLSSYSLKDLEVDPKYKFAFFKVMSNRKLSSYHLDVMNRTKNAPMNSTCPHYLWDGLVKGSLSEEPNSEARKALKHLFDVLEDFAPEASSLNILESPIYDNSSDQRFWCWRAALGPRG